MFNKLILLLLSLAGAASAQITPGPALTAQQGTLAQIPASCSTGQLFFADDQPAGANIFGCTTPGNPGVWTLQGSGGSPGGAAGGALCGTYPAPYECPSIAAPASPVNGQLWNSSSLTKVKAPNSPLERYPLGIINGQEQTVVTIGSNVYDFFTSAGGNISVMSCPTTANFWQASFFYGTVSGTTLTVTEPVSSIPSPDNAGFIQAGMTLQSGTGAVIQPFGTGSTTGVGGVGTYALSGSPGTVANPIELFANFWTIPTSIIGNGTGGVAGGAAHGSFYTEDNVNLYFFFAAITTSGSFSSGYAYVATANVSNITSWTASTTAVLAPIAGTGGQGNVFVHKMGTNSYLLTRDAVTNVAFPYEGAVNNWQSWFATATTIAGPYTLLNSSSPVTSLRPGPNAMVGHVRIYQEGSTCIALYHLGMWGRVLPEDGFRATIPCANVTADAWTVLDNRAPFIRRKHPFEVDQVADLSYWIDPNGQPWLFSTAADNRTPVFYLMATPLEPIQQQYNGTAWVPVQSGYDAPEWVNNAWILQTTNTNPVIQSPADYYGAWTPTVSSSSVTGGLLVSDSAQNDYVDFDYCCWAPGQYAITLTYETTSAGGIITPTLEDGANGYIVSLVTTANQISYSNTLSNATWSAINLTITANNVTGPDGSATSGNTLTATSTSGDRAAAPGFTVPVIGQTYTTSAYFHAGTTDGYVALVQGGTVLAYEACSSLSTTPVCRNSGGGETGTITSVGNGWYRISVTKQNAGSGTLVPAVGPQDNTGLVSGYPKCTSGLTVLVYGVQLENSSVMNTYVPTTSPTIDTYSLTPTFNTTYTITFQILGTELYRRKIRLTMATHNASSSAYGLSLIGLAIQRKQI